MIVSCRFSKDSPYTFSTQFLQPVNIQGASKLKRIHYFLFWWMNMKVIKNQIVKEKIKLDRGYV